MSLLTRILDAMSPPRRGLTADELRTFKKCFVQNDKSITARIEKGEYTELCVRPKDMTKFKVIIAKHGLATTELITEILRQLDEDKDSFLRFRHDESSSH